MEQNDSFFDIQKELKKLPTQPGVYIMHGPADEIIYVGKAINLRNRVRQYFQSQDGKTAKIRKMISLIRRFEYIVVDSELEALVLENNLIKENKPKYNTLLKDDKTYPYIKVTVAEDFPRILSTRKVIKDKARYFGPYTSAGSVKDTIDLLHRLFMIRTCSRRLPEEIGKERPCLYKHIGQCTGPCDGSASRSDYRSQVDKALDFLTGKYDYVRNYLNEKMLAASEAMEFEKAIEYRDLLKAVADISEKQKVTSADTDDRDIVGVYRNGKDAVAQVFFIRDGRMIGREHFHLDVDEHDEEKQIVASFVKQFYTGTPYIPKEIWLQTEIDDAELIKDWLSSAGNRKVNIIIPKKGEKNRMVELACENAKIVLDKDYDRIRREEKRTSGALKEVAGLLGLKDLVRTESYDISNTNGFDSVGSMVVFENGMPKRNDYRKFKIRTVAGPDDYASLKEVLERRFRHGLEELKSADGTPGSSFSRFPDVILMDGGKGQVNIAESVLEELKLDIPVAGMVKDDHHRTRGLIFRNEEIPIDTGSEAFRLITRIQDETHRFAIEYHRSLLGSRNVHSVLDDIEGIGTVRRRALMKHFKDIEKLKNAEVGELMEVDGMNRSAAESVYAYFHKA